VSSIAKLSALPPFGRQTASNGFAQTVILRFFSSSVQSAALVPSPGFPNRSFTPNLNSRASTSDVLPLPVWPTKTKLRTSAIGMSFIVACPSLSLAVPREPAGREVRPRKCAPYTKKEPAATAK